MSKCKNLAKILRVNIGKLSRKNTKENACKQLGINCGRISGRKLARNSKKLANDHKTLVTAITIFGELLEKHPGTALKMLTTLLRPIHVEATFLRL